MNDAPTLPLPSRQQEWEDARRLHLKCFGRMLAAILRYLAWARDPRTLAVRLNWFAGQGLLKAKKHTAAAVASAVLSPDGKALFAALNTMHQHQDVERNLLTGTFCHLESAVAAVHAIKAHTRNMADIDLCMLLLYEIFNYDKFVEGLRLKMKPCGEIYWGKPDQVSAESSSEEKAAWSWCAGEYIIKTGVRYCTYCNADTVFAVRVTGGRIRPYASALDHFRPRSDYPYLALALSNLVPTCTRCNSLFKGKNVPPVVDPVSPFEADYYGLFDFVVDPGKTKQIEGFIADPNDQTWKVTVPDGSSNQERRASGMAVKMFHLDDVYNQVFREDVSRMIYLVRLLTPANCATLAKMYPRIFAHKDARNLIMGSTLNHAEIPVYRFSKLAECLSRQFS